MRWLAVLLALMCFDVWYRAHTFGPDVNAAMGARLWPRPRSSTKEARPRQPGGPGLESEPLDCDEAAYAYMGRRILKGDVLYRDLTENKPPLGYWIYAGALAALGDREISVRLMVLPLVLATIAGVWKIARLLAGPLAALAAALMFVLLSTDPFLFGNGSPLEHIMNCFAAWSLALLVAGWGRGPMGPLRPFAIGACLGAAALVKQVAIVPLFVFAPALLARSAARAVSSSSSPSNVSEVPARGGRRWVAGAFDVAWLVAGVGLVAGAAFAVLAARGAGPDAYRDIVRLGRALATDVLPEPNAPPAAVRWLTGNADPKGGLPWPFGTTNYLVWWGAGSWPLWLASAPALVYLGLAPGGDARRRIVAAWTIAAWAQVVLPGLYWQHYYLLPVPGAAIAIAIALADAVFVLGRALPRRRGREPSASGPAPAPAAASIARAALAATALTAALGAEIFLQTRDYLLVSPEMLTVRYKGGRQWVVLRALGRELARRSTVWDGPKLYVWGWQSPLHFYGRLDSPTRHFFVNNLLRDQAEGDHPLVRPQIEEILRTLERRPPEMVFAGYPPFPALRAFLKARYLPSRLVPHDGRSGIGLWIARGDYGRFESAGL